MASVLVVQFAGTAVGSRIGSTPVTVRASIETGDSPRVPDAFEVGLVFALGPDPVAVAEGADSEPAQEAVNSPTTARPTATPQALRINRPPCWWTYSDSVNVDADHRREA